MWRVITGPEGVAFVHACNVVKFMFWGLLVKFDVRKIDASSNYFIVMTDKFCYDCFFLPIKQYIVVA